MCRRGGALVTVAHRLVTARDADTVVVLDECVVVEHGSPTDLVARRGVFAALVELESANWST